MDYSCKAKVVVQPFCGDRPCDEVDDPDAGALLVRRIIVNGHDLVFSSAKFTSEGNPGILGLTVDFVPTAIEVVMSTDPQGEDA